MPGKPGKRLIIWNKAIVGALNGSVRIVHGIHMNADPADDDSVNLFAAAVIPRRAWTRQSNNRYTDKQQPYGHCFRQRPGKCPRKLDRLKPNEAAEGSDHQ